MVEPFFFATEGGLRLLGVWRRPPQPAPKIWVVCPPFAEEEKSARRTLTEICQSLVQRGHGTLLFSYRGTGDSEGDFADATLELWRQDVQAAVAEARHRAPAAEIGLLGLRLGASLALQEAHPLGVKSLILLEPLLSGRSFVTQMNARKKIRAQLTSEAETAAAPDLATELPADDLDGWAFGPALRESLSKLDLQRQPVNFTGQALIFQIGPRSEVSPPLQALSQTLGATATAVVMPPFWNLLDYAPSDPLLEALDRSLAHA